MKLFVYPALLCSLLTVPAQAVEWPWQSHNVVHQDYCKGFIVGSLAEDELGGLSRTHLWLAWNYVNRHVEEGAQASDSDYSEGRQQVDALLASNDLQGVADIANGDCALGRN